MVVVNRMRLGQTLVPNIFIDRYLAGAGGEFVKVYLMLLRQIDSGSMSVSRIADSLEISESEVLKALNFWEDQGLLALEYDGTRLTRLVVNDLPGTRGELRRESEEVRIERKASAGADTQTDASAGSASRKESEAHKVSTDPAGLLAADPEFKQLAYVAEQYLGRTLTKADLELIAWIYDDLKFSFDLSEYLLAYCAQLGHRNLSYIKAVAIGWKQNKIEDVESAKKRAAEFTAQSESRSRKQTNNFKNFDQRKTDLNDIITQEIKNGSQQPAV